MGNLTVPVGVFATSADKLIVVGDGIAEEVDLPVPPFSIVELSQEDEGAERINLIGGGESYVGINYHHTIPVKKRPGSVVEVPQIDYVLELIKEFPEKLQSLAPGGFTPYPMFIDIETMSTEEHFPKADRDQVLSIQVKYKDSEPLILVNEKMTMDSEGEMLEKFIDYVKSSPSGRSPDFMTGYFLNKFDIPYLKTRIGMYSDLKSKFLSLNRSSWNEQTGRPYELYYQNWMYGNRLKGEEVDLAYGIMNLDLFVHAKSDLSLVHLPSRSLKNVTRAYGGTVFDIEVEEKKDMATLLREDPDRFMRYAMSDLVATEYLYNIYETRLMAAANLLVCPMLLVHRMSSGQKSYLALYRECRKNGYFSLRKNEERYTHLYEKAEKYQGALVACYRRGYFGKTVYLDAKSMYPNIMHDFNISYDRYRVLDIIDYDDWEKELQNIPEDAHSQEPLVKQFGDDSPRITSYGPPTERIIYIPDDNYRMVLKYEFDLLSDGFVRRLINHYNSVRDEFKKKAKALQKKYHDTKEEAYRFEYMNYDSTQAEAKIINNTFYGIQGNKYYDIADLPAAIFVTALGRWLMTEMVRLFGKKAVIEIDTDGLLLDSTYVKMEIDEINDTLRGKISDAFGISKDRMNFLLEFEEEGSVYMYKRKNYILRKDSDPDTLYPKGSAFKGYDKAEVIQRAVSIMSEAIMYHSDDPDAYGIALDKARDIRKVYEEKGLAPFKFTKTLKKNPEDYKGYRNVEVDVFNIDRTLSNKEQLATMKSKAIGWISSMFGSKEKKNKRGDNFRAMIKACKNEDDLKYVISTLAYIQPREDRATSYYFMLDLIMKLQQKGRTVEFDDVIEYYYTTSTEQYTLAEEMGGDKRLDFDRYQDDIENILKRFSLADPRKNSLMLFDMLEDDDEEVEVEEGYSSTDLELQED